MDRFSGEHFRNYDAARAFLETLLWPEGPVCPHCGVLNHAYPTKRRGLLPMRQKGVPEGFHRDHGNGDGAVAYRPA